MDKLERVLNRLKTQYSAYANEREAIEDGDGFIDISVACDLADYIPYLIETIEKQQESIDEFKSALWSCKYHAQSIIDSEYGETSDPWDIVEDVVELLGEE